MNCAIETKTLFQCIFTQWIRVHKQYLIAVLVKKAIEGLTEIPPKGDIKVMQGYSDGRKRLRVGKYRIIYQYRDDGNVYVWVIEIATRGDIYK